MNERIQKLAEQTVEMVSTKRNLSDGQVERAWSPDHFNEAFAELIVKECLHVIGQESEKVSGEWRCKDGQHIWWKVKEHFGVQV